MAEIFVDTKQLHSLATELGEFPKKAPKEILVPALNDTVGVVKTDLYRRIAGKAGLYTIPQKDVRKEIKVKKASQLNTSAAVVVRGRPKGLMHFKINAKAAAKQKGKKVAKRTPIKVTINKQKGVRTLKTINPAAFVAVANGTPNVFHRKGKNSLPIERITTLSVPHMATAKVIINPVQKLAQEHLAKRINHHLHRKLKVKGGKK